MSSHHIHLLLCGLLISALIVFQNRTILGLLTNSIRLVLALGDYEQRYTYEHCYTHELSLKGLKSRVGGSLQGDEHV